MGTVSMDATECKQSIAALMKVQSLLYVYCSHLYHGKPYESKAPTGEYTLKTTDRREISIFPSPQGNIKLSEGSKQHALTDRRL